MKLNTKIKVLGILGLLAGSSLSSGAQVLLTVEEIDTGGVSVTASGSINTSAFTFLGDLENDDGGNVFGFLSVDSFLINRSGDEEIFLAQGFQRLTRSRCHWSPSSPEEIYLMRIDSCDFQDNQASPVSYTHLTLPTKA